MMTPQWLHDYREIRYARAYKRAMGDPCCGVEAPLVCAYVMAEASHELSKKSDRVEEADKLSYCIKGAHEMQEDKLKHHWWIWLTPLERILLVREEFNNAVDEGYITRAQYLLSGVEITPHLSLGVIIAVTKALKEERENQ